MEEACRDDPDHKQRQPKKRPLTKLQKDIYEFLKQDKPQKALAIAKAIGKTSASDVNPDLYRMQTWNLLGCNENKLWSIKAESHASENKAENNAKIEQVDSNGPATPGPLTDEQRDIFTLLQKNRPMRAKDIANWVGKSNAKNVNPDLYTMKKMDLLTHSNNLWAVKYPNDTRCEKDNEECEVQGTARSSSINLSDSHFPSPNQTDIENQNNQLCNGPQCNNDSGTASVDPTIVKDLHITQPANVGSTVQTYSNTVNHPPVVKYYNICIQNSQNISVGDSLMSSGCCQDVGYMTGDSTAVADASGAWEALQQPGQPLGLELVNNMQSEDSFLNMSNLSTDEEIQGGPPPHTSSPAHTDQCRLEFSDICDGIEKVNLG